MSILPDATAYGNQTDAHTNISEQVDRPLHGVGNSEVSVFALIEPANEKNSAAKSDELHDGLDERKLTHDLGAVNRASNQRRRTFVENRRRYGTEKTHEPLRRESWNSV
jgi:hypothetical protein